MLIKQDQSILRNHVDANISIFKWINFRKVSLNEAQAIKRGRRGEVESFIMSRFAQLGSDVTFKVWVAIN